MIKMLPENTFRYTLAVLSFAVLLYGAVPHVLLSIDQWQLTLGDTHNGERLWQTRASFATLLGGVLAAVALLISYQRVLASDRRYALEERGHVTERLSAAIEHLGHESAVTRVGAMYALDALVAESLNMLSESERPNYSVGPRIVAEALAAYIRTHEENVRSKDDTADADHTQTAPDMRVDPGIQPAFNILGKDTYRMLSLDLRKIRLSVPISLTGNFAGADFFESELPYINNIRGGREQPLALTRANFFHCNLRESELKNADLSHSVMMLTNLAGADLSHSKLTGVDFSYANLSSTILEYCDLRDATFEQGILKHSNLQQADLRGASFANPGNLESVNFTGAIIDEETVLPDAERNHDALCHSYCVLRSGLKEIAVFQLFELQKQSIHLSQGWSYLRDEQELLACLQKKQEIQVFATDLTNGTRLFVEFRCRSVESRLISPRTPWQARLAIHELVVSW